MTWTCLIRVEQEPKSRPEFAGVGEYGAGNVPAPFLFRLVGFGDGQGFVDVMMSAVDVLEHASLKAAGCRVVFLFGDIMMGLGQEVAGLMQVAAPGQMGIDWFVLVDIFAVVDGCFLDFVDGVINFFNGVLFFDVDGGAVGTMLQVRPGVAQIGQSMDVGRMAVLSVGVGCGERHQKSESRREQCKTEKRFHADNHLRVRFVFTA